MHRRIRATLAALALALPLAAHAALDPATDRRVGGVLSNACADRSQVMIRLYGDTLDIERGPVAVKASRLKVDKTAVPGVADFLATVRGQVKGGDGITLVLSHNAQGLYARIDGSEQALAPLGPGVVGQTLRHCDPNRNALPGAPPPVRLAPPDLLKDARFKAAYMQALGPLAREPWLARLNGPAPELRQVKLAGGEYTLAASCKPHDCYDHSTVLLWSPGQGQLLGLVQQRGRNTLLGAPTPAQAGELQRLWADEFRKR